MNLETSVKEGKLRKIFLCYPPGPLYQRGEDRSQGNISDSAATVMRAPNDMAYTAAIMKEKGYGVSFRDFQTEGLTEDDLFNEFIEYSPDVVVISITNSTVHEDLVIANKLKKINKKLVIILKGALFFDAPPEVISSLDLTDIDYLIGGEIEFAIDGLLDAKYNNYDVSLVPGILYRNSNNIWIKNMFGEWDGDLDLLPFPDRSILNNKLYIRPDTGSPQATIVTSRGCPAACIYCLTPKISGKKVRFRSPQNILDELIDCYENHSIKDFFFRSDTFTIDQDWVREVCNKINNSKLKGKIEWVANSRVKPLADDTLKIMKEAGCWLVAFGFESGSPDSLKKMQKGATVDDNIRAARLAKEAGLLLYGFFIIGLPWERKEHLEDTYQHIFDLDADFIELHISVPYYGTELYNLTKDNNLLNKSVIGTDYFHASTSGTKFVSSDDLLEFRRKLLLKYHLRPKYIFRKLRETITKPKKILNYARFGVRLIINNLHK